MALSGSCVVKATSQNNLIFSWGATQDIAANASTVSWQLILEAGQFGRIDAGPGSPWRATVAGKQFSGTTDLSIGNHQTKVLASGQVNVTHSSDGSGWFDFSFTQEFWIQFGSEYISTVSGSGSAALDTIARVSAPTVSAAEVELGGLITIYTNRASDALNHRISWRFGNADGIIAEGVADQVEWRPLLDLAKQIPNAVSGTAVISCATYAGSTPIGTKEVTLTLTVPADIVPTASAAWEDTSGAYGKVGTLVQGISKLRIDVTGTGAYGSTVTGASVNLNGKAYGGGILTDAGANSLGITVTDSRGRVGSRTDSLPVAPYAQPVLSVNASRCTADGTPDESGDHARITVSGFVTQVNGRNSAALTVAWGGDSQRIEQLTGNVSWQKTVSADINATMVISAALEDKLAAAARTMTLSTGYATMDFLAGGKGVSLGKAATMEGFDCAMGAFFRGGLYEIHSDGSIDSRSLFERVAALEASL